MANYNTASITVKSKQTVGYFPVTENELKIVDNLIDGRYPESPIEFARAFGSALTLLESLRSGYFDKKEKENK